MGLSIRAYARHRGVSHVAVKKAIDTGRITALPDGTIDPDAADAQWAQNTLQPRRAAASEKVSTTKARSAPAEATPQRDAVDGSTAPMSASGTSLLQARTVNEVLKAKLNNLELAHRKKELVDRAQAVAHVDAVEARRLLDVAWEQVDPSHAEQPVQLRTIEALTHLSELDLVRAAEVFAAAARSEPAAPGYFGRSALVLRPLCLHLAGAHDEALDALEVAAQLPGVDDTFLQAIVRAYVHATVRPNAAALRALLGAIDDRDPAAMTEPFAVAAAAELARSDGATALADQLFGAMAAHRWHSRHEGLAAHVRTRLVGHEPVSAGEAWSTADLVDQARVLAQA